MTPQIERLKTLVSQLIVRLEHEKTENRRLTTRLATCEAELEQTRRRLEEMRKKAEAMLSTFGRGPDTLL